LAYFFYCRDRPGLSSSRWTELVEAHWSFMDRYADVMIARGPTLTDDDKQRTGSMHLVDLPDAAAAQRFAFEEPFYRAGLFADVLLHRWSNSLGRTMWNFTRSGGRRFLIIAHGVEGSTTRHDEVRPLQRQYHADTGYGDALIAFGPMLSDDGTEWLGTVMAVELADRAEAEAMVSNGPLAQAGLFKEVEIHNWCFGGRPQQ
jgi:uncharacterized protein YciI